MAAAGFWIRFLASFLDSLILGLLSCFIGLMILGMVYWFRLLLHLDQSSVLFNSLDSFLLQLVLVGIRLVLSAVYFVFGHYLYGASVGKRIFKIQVVAQSGDRITLKQSVIRYLSYGLSYLFFGGGFLIAGLDPKKRALHDHLAGTICVKKGLG